MLACPEGWGWVQGRRSRRWRTAAAAPRTSVPRSLPRWKETSGSKLFSGVTIWSAGGGGRGGRDAEQRRDLVERRSTGTARRTR